MATEMRLSCKILENVAMGCDLDKHFHAPQQWFRVELKCHII